MKKKSFWKSVAACVLVVGCLLLAGCGGGGTDPFTTYTEAFNKVKSNGGFDADISAQLTMDGTTTSATGNFKVDDSGDSTILYLKATVDGETMTQFSDGEYLYVESHDSKVKYPLGEKQEEASNEDLPTDAPEFSVNDFLKEFASFIEAGKMQEMGLLEPLPANYVSETKVDGNVYHLTVKDQVLSRLQDTLSDTVAVEGESVTAKDLKDVTYDATIENGYVTALTVGGTMTVTVPAAVSGAGEQTYPLDITITAKFNNPGEAVSITLPSTDGFAE